MDSAGSALSADVPTSAPTLTPSEEPTMAPISSESLIPPLPPTPSATASSISQSTPKEGRSTPRSAASTTPRLSARARKPSAKVAEMAEAGPSGTSGMEHIEQMKPQPRFLQPDHFSGLNNGAKPPCGGRTRWEPVYAEDDFLSPEDDPLALRGIPVFRPTMEEFQDFEGYINKTAPWGMRSGIAKIIPPKEWTDNLPAMSSRTLSQVHIKSPIQQNMMGTAGIFRAQNIEKNKTRPLSVKEWFDKCQNEKFAGPSPKVVERDSREAAVAREEIMREKKEKWAKKKEDKLRRKEERAAEEEAAKFEAVELKEEPESAEAIVAPDAELNVDVDMGEGSVEKTDSVPGLDAPSSGSSHSSPEPPKTPEEPLDDWYHSTDFNTAWLPKNTSPEDYTTEACVRLAEKYWKTMGLGEPSWYGADLMQGSLFADVKTPWNVAHLPNLLDRINCIVPGVNEPYLYFGMWRATFAWHVEDMDLFSINFIHFGAPKFWYAIPQAQADHFERFMANEFPLDARECDQFIRHKSMAISPTRLKDAQTRVNMLVHNQGEFVITYPRGYHAGFNMGFNCAESVNFATDDWVDYGRKAKHCKCVNFSVRIDIDTMLAEAEDLVQQERDDPGLKRAREEEDGAAAEINGDAPPAKTPRKRVRKPKPAAIAPTEGPLAEIESNPSLVTGEDSIMTSAPMDPAEAVLPKAKKQAKAAPRKIASVKERPVYRCLFCPSLSTTDLCPVYDPNEFVKAQWKGAAGEPLAVHLMCAQSTPECYFHEEAVEGMDSTIWVMGVNNVVKDRWSALKCKLCPDKARAASGVKVQCTKGKCPAAFHYSCAKADDHLKTELWQVEEWVPAPIPEGAPPGTEPTLEKISNVKLELLCATHNPAQKEIKEREKAEELRQRILRFSPGSMIKIKSGSGCCEYKLVAIHEDVKVVELEIRPGTNIKAAWGRVDFRSAAPVKVVENEYARHHVTSRKADVPAMPPVTSQALPPRPYPAGYAPPAPSNSNTAGPSRMVHPPPSSSHSYNPSYATTMVSARNQAPSAANLFPYLTAQAMYPPTVLSQSPVPQPLPRQAPPIGSWPPDNRQHIHARPSQPQSVPNGGNLSHPTVNAVQRGYPQPGYMPQTWAAPPPPPDNFARTGAGLYPSYTPQQHIQTFPPHHLPPGYHQHQTPQGSAYHHLQTNPSAPPDARVYLQSNRYRPELADTRRMSVQSHHSSGSSSAPSGMQHLLNPSSGDGVAGTAQSAISNGQTPRNGSVSGASGSVGKIDLGLERMHRLMATIGRLDTPAIHIAGTNGKGSVSAIIESVLRAAGFQTARYNSPHLLEPRDAIRLNGRPVNADAYYRAISHFEQTSSRLGINATSFEINTVSAYALMAELKPDIMIIECGMGGARDATNVIPPDLVLATVLTPVGLDHTAFLGNTIEAIAEEKSSIAVRGALFIVARQPAEAAVYTAHAVGQARGAQTYNAYNVIETPTPRSPSADVDYGTFVRPAPRSVSFQVDSMLDLAGNPLPSSSLKMLIPLPGDHQISNASTAITLLNRLRYHPRAIHILPRLGHITLDHLKTGLERTKWAGRCSWLEPRNPTAGVLPILLDGAHNADSAASLRKYIDSCLPTGGARVNFIISLSDSKGKTPESVLQPLLRPGDDVAVVEFTGPIEGMPWIKPVSKGVITGISEGIVGEGQVWGGIEEGTGEGGKGDKFAGLKGALKWAKEKGGLTVICGSLYLVADAYRVLGIEGYH